MEQELELSAVIGFQGKLLECPRPVWASQEQEQRSFPPMYPGLAVAHIYFRQGNGGARTSP